MIGVIWNSNGRIILRNIDYSLDLTVNEKASICIPEKKKKKEKDSWILQNYSSTIILRKSMPPRPFRDGLVIVLNT